MHRVFTQQTSYFINQSPYALSISTLDRAKCLFISTHVFGSHPSFHYLKAFFPPKESDDFLIHGVQSVCLAYLWNHTGDYEVMCKARMKYSQALQATGKVLGKKGQAERKEALVAVLLMDCFERLTRDGPHQNKSSFKPLNSPTDAPEETTDKHEKRNDAAAAAELKHLVGGIALCKLRGPSQFEDPVSISLFHHLSCNILVSCLYRRVPLPMEYVQLRAQASTFIAPHDANWRAEKLLINFMDFRNWLEVRDVHTDAEEALARSKTLEKEYRALCKIFLPLPDEQLVETNKPTAANPRKGRNNFCSVREAMDIMFRLCSEMVQRNSTHVEYGVSLARQDLMRV
ncbi:uncharacterized protein PAC_09994 [Phialocephala subalpina]|uniref:Uncharacterized protein n=1 Tax=Phialocephala subalpina TaxID=576137 RepID=A0A1L7X4Z7_9HELO|nr:uncharacterized protein PAC_09994 [Phialocephala subalpina]